MSRQRDQPQRDPVTVQQIGAFLGLFDGIIQPFAEPLCL